MNSALFKPFALGTVEAPNRIVMAPMSRARAAADGTPTSLMVTYYAQRADAGLIIAESAHVSATGRIGPGAPGLHTDAHEHGWARIAGAVHNRGGRIFVQLAHAGRLAHPDFLPGGLPPVAPSSVAAQTDVFTPYGRQSAVVPTELTNRHIRSVIGDFVQASRRAVAAGLDGVEIHAANGYLLHQFLSANANTRTDHWGSSPDGHARLTAETVRAVAAAIGPERVGLRISPCDGYGELDEPLAHRVYPALLRALAEETHGPIAYLHLTETGHAAFDDRLRELWPSALLVTPRATDPADPSKERAALNWLERGADLIAFGRGFLTNPDFVDRLRTGARLNSPRDIGLYGGDHRGYTDYPTLGQLNDLTGETGISVSARAQPTAGDVLDERSQVGREGEPGHRGAAAVHAISVH